MPRSRPSCLPTPERSKYTGVRSSPIGRPSTGSSSASTSRCRCSGTSTSSAIRKATAIPVSASCTEAGKPSSRSRCARPTWVATSCSSISGDTVPVIVDRLTGEVRQAQIFVAVMGDSSFTYVEATWTQTLGDWIGAHTRALAAIGGVPRLIVPDNAKVAVIKACLYEPQVNRTYAEMAVHYGTAVLPTRPRRPRDKAKVEACVLIVERWLIGRLRDRRFYSLAEL